MKHCPAVIFAVVFVTFANTAAADGLLNLCSGYAPGTFAVESAASDDAKQFAGAFRGKWGSKLDHILIIDKITANGEVAAFYGWGDPDKSPPVNAGCRRLMGTIAGPVLRFELGPGKDSSYRLTPDGLLVGEHRYRNGLMIGLFQRFDPMRREPLATIEPPSKAIFPSGYVSELVDTPLRKDGKPLRLQLIISKPEGDGPFPLLVFNHGSTGGPDRDTSARNVRVFHPVSRYFLSKGWMVAMPQRRGRGWSDGLHDEGLLSDRSRYSCEARVALEGLEQAITDIEAILDVLLARPYVDTGRIVMGGNSRGGGLSIAFAGTHRGKIGATINVAGGWISGCASAVSINQRLAVRAAFSSTPSLWIYGEKDEQIDPSTMRNVFGAFEDAGGVGQFVEISGAGHALLWESSNWTKYVGAFMIENGYSEFAE